MEIIPNSKKINCEIVGCKNIANFAIKYKKSFINNGLFLCKNCLNDLYVSIGAHIVPKSPINMLNTEKRKEKKYENKK